MNRLGVEEELTKAEAEAAAIANRPGTCDRCPREHKQNFGCVNWRPLLDPVPVAEEVSADAV